MKRSIFLLVLLLFVVSLCAQDQIVTVGNDTIHCKILAVETGKIHYELKKTDGFVARKFIPMGKVSTYVCTSASTPDIKQAYYDRPGRVVPERPWQLSLSSGGSYMPRYFGSAINLGSIPEEYNSLRRGFHVNAAMHYMLNESWGIGFEYAYHKSGYKSQNAKKLFTLDPGESTLKEYADLKEDFQQYVSSMGISVLCRQRIGRNQKFQLNETLSTRTLSYQMEEQLIFSFPNSSNVISESVIPASTTGNTFYSKIGLTADYYLLPNISVGVVVSC